LFKETQMSDYEVNVRAIVNATRGPSATPGIEPDVPDWEVYDFEANTRDSAGVATQVTLRCDQFVRVSADTAEEAIEAAKMDAIGIAIADWAIDSVTLWVDESIDVELVPPVAVAPGMTV
jgi:hypothetical protein